LQSLDRGPHIAVVDRDYVFAFVIGKSLSLGKLPFEHRGSRFGGVAARALPLGDPLPQCIRIGVECQNYEEDIPPRGELSEGVAMLPVQKCGVHDYWTSSRQANVRATQEHIVDRLPSG
jgi:hypothetical protein